MAIDITKGCAWRIIRARGCDWVTPTWV